MVVEKPLIGRYVRLDSCTEEDAEFTRDIRMLPDIRSCFPAFENTLEMQKRWIDRQQKKEGDYFFVVRDLNGKRIGTTGLYDICDGSGECGRLVIRGDAIRSIEAQLLCTRFAFEELGLEKLTGFIFADNKRAIRSSSIFGTEISDRETDETGNEIVKTVLTRDVFFNREKEIVRLLYSEEE